MLSKTINEKKATRKKGKGKEMAASKGGPGEWSSCSHCGKRVKTENLPRHVKKMHGVQFISEPPRSKGHGKWYKTIALLIVVMLLITAYLAFRNPGTEDDLDGPLPADAPGSNDNGDPPHHAQGSGNDDWWTTYPAKHGSSGTEVEHPQWALDELPDRSIVLLVYSNCAGCLRQKDAIEKVLKDHKGDITYISISAYEDDRGAECDEVYGNGFIPLTIFITHIKTGNDINIAWHSQDGQTGEDWIRSYMEDAIYYHTQAG